MRPAEDQQDAIEQNEGWLAGFDSPAPSPGLIEQIKAAVRCELGVRWLASSAGKTIEPPDELLGRIKATVRRELRVAGSARAGWADWRRGMLAAAAMLIAAVGVGQFAAMHAPVAPPAPQVDPIEEFVASLDAVLAEQDPQLQWIEEDLASLEAGLLPDSASLVGQGDPVLDALRQELETLATEGDEFAGAS